MMVIHNLALLAPGRLPGRIRGVGSETIAPLCACCHLVRTLQHLGPTRDFWVLADQMAVHRLLACFTGSPNRALLRSSRRAVLAPDYAKIRESAISRPNVATSTSHNQTAAGENSQEDSSPWRYRFGPTFVLLVAAAAQADSPPHRRCEIGGPVQARKEHQIE